MGIIGHHQIQVGNAGENSLADQNLGLVRIVEQNFVTIQVRERCGVAGEAARVGVELEGDRRAEPTIGTEPCVFAEISLEAAVDVVQHDRASDTVDPPWMCRRVGEAMHATREESWNDSRGGLVFMDKSVEYSYLKRADALIEINRFPEAITELNKFLSYFPENYDAFCKLSLCFYELNELNKSLEFSKNAIESNPLGEWAYRLQSIIYRASGNHQKSFVAAENCIKQSPFSLYSMQNLAYSQINLFRFDEAKNRFQRR